MRDARTVFMGNVIARALGFLFPLLLVYVLSKSEFATVSFFIGTGFLAASLVLNSLPVAMTRHLASERDGRQWLESAVVAGIPIIVIAVCFGEALAAVVGEPLGYMTVMVVGLSIDAYYWGLLRGLGRFRLLVGYRAAANALQLVLLTVLLVVGGGGVLVVLVIFSYVYLIPIAVIELRARPIRSTLESGEQMSRAAASRLLRFAGPTFLIGLAYAVFISADIFFVRLLDPDSVGDYAIAKTLAQPITLVSFAIGVVILPRAAKATEAERWRLLKLAVGVCAVFALAASAATFVLGGPVVDHLLPASYAPAEDILPLIGLAVALLGVYSVIGEWWVGAGRPFLAAYTLGAGALLAIGLQFLLTPRYGGEGAALALTGGVTFALVLLGAITAKTAATRQHAQQTSSS